MKQLSLLLLTGLLAISAAQAQARRHIVVILDTSKSMLEQDPKRLATLSTAMLFDLARPDLASGDTFEVIPFPSGGQKWTDSSEPCEERAGNIIEPTRGSSGPAAAANLQSQLAARAYDSNWTYFYPPLCTAMKRLESREGDRIIVVLTDGLSDRPDADQGLILGKLAGKMIETNTRLQVLAFGDKASEASAFFQPVVNPSDPAINPDRRSLGEVFEDPSGQQLVENMIEIFGRCCGYVSETVNGNQLRLRGRVIPENVAVVAFLKTKAQPGFELSPSEPLGMPNPVRTAAESGSSYALRWLTAPIPESAVPIRTASPNATIAILRPPEVELSWTNPEGFETLATRNDLCRQVELRLKGGTKEEPPEDITLSFRISGPEYIDGWFPASGGELNADKDARLFQVCPVFKDTFPTGADSYLGRLEVRAMRGEVTLETLTGVEGMAATVKPLLRIRSTPATADADRTNLSRAEVGCANFALLLEPSERFEARAATGRPYRLTAALDPKADMRGGPLSGASVRLQVLGSVVASRPVRADEPGRDLWTAELDSALIERLKRSENPEGQELPFQACVEIGRPSEGGPAEVGLHFSLAETPYRDMPLGALSDPFTVKLDIAHPDFWQRYWSLLTLLLLLLLLALLAWYTRYRLTLPPDFRAAPGASPQGPFTPQPLGEAPLFRKLAGLDAEFPIEAPGNQTPLGWIQPLGDDLYAFRPPADARELQQQVGAEWREVPSADGRTYPVEARRSYRYQTSGGELRTFRAEFER